MEEVTIQIPTVGTEAYFVFKEPFNTYLKTKHKLDPTIDKLKVTSIISMKDMIRNDLKDPFTKLYEPVGISESDYKQDLVDNVPILSFSFIDRNEVEKFIRCPANYIQSYSDITNIEYINKLLVIDLGNLPIDLDTTVVFNDLKSFITTRLGVIPEFKEVSTGQIEFVTKTEHLTRETIRTNTVTVNKTLEVNLSELQLKYDNLIQRLATLGIVLG